MSELPEGVASVMFLRDGWPDCVVCKVLMTDGRVGIGLVRQPKNISDGVISIIFEWGPETADESAMVDALRNIGGAPPDYTEIQEHVARMKAEAQQ